jgi:nitroreductase/NAD-dependent dihydropyrimidine dehydrogenase PreA subunit
MISIDYDKCDNCNLCYQACLSEIIAKGPRAMSDCEEHCIECGHCYAVCPLNAITVLGYEEIEERPLPEEKPVSGKAMMDLLRARRSCRGFRKGVPVPEEDLRAIIDAASVAPSAHNTRPLKAYVYRDPGTIEKVRRRTLSYYRRIAPLFKSRAFALIWRLSGLDSEEHKVLSRAFEQVQTDLDGKDILFYDAPCLLLITAPRLNSMAQGDAWLASENALLYADTIGVATCFNGFLIMAVNWDLRLRLIMRIPWKERVVGALMVGYARRDWQREAPRKPLPTEWR